MAHRETDSWIDEFNQYVRDAAYFLWENDGRPEGREKEYWQRALEQSVRQRNIERRLREAAQAPQRGRDAN